MTVAEEARDLQTLLRGLRGASEAANRGADAFSPAALLMPDCSLRTLPGTALVSGGKDGRTPVGGGGVIGSTTAFGSSSGEGEPDVGPWLLKGSGGAEGWEGCEGLP